MRMERLLNNSTFLNFSITIIAKMLDVSISGNNDFKASKERTYKDILSKNCRY